MRRETTRGIIFVQHISSIRLLSCIEVRPITSQMASRMVEQFEFVLARKYRVQVIISELNSFLNLVYECWSWIENSFKL